MSSEDLCCQMQSHDRNFQPAERGTTLSFEGKICKYFLKKNVWCLFRHSCNSLHSGLHPIAAPSNPNTNFA